MTEEVLNEGVTETPAADDVRSIISAAIESQRAGNTEATSQEGASDTGTAAPDASDNRARDDQGRFVPKEAAQEGAQAKPQDGKPVTASAQQQKDEKADPEPAQADQGAIRPPPGWSPKSKAAFDSLPSEVKADIAKREQEINQGFAKLTEYKGLERFADQARSSGTTLEAALTNYTNWENAFKRDPYGSVAQLASNLGIHPQQFAQTLVQRFAGAQQPQTDGQQGQPQAGVDPNAMQIHPALLQEILQLKNAVANQESERANQQRQTTAQNVDSFFADPKNKFADNVSEIMVGLINQAKASGQKIDLPTIYDQACWLHPEVRDMLINERTASHPAVSNAAKAQAAAQARNAAKAVTGAPGRGTTPTGSPPPNESLRDTIMRSVASQRGT